MDFLANLRATTSSRAFSFPRWATSLHLVTDISLLVIPHR
jgi:hypothetical protein